MRAGRGAAGLAHDTAWRWLYAALALAAVSQIVLAVSAGSLPGSARAQWSVSLLLCLGLSLPTTALLLAIWRTRDIASSTALLIAIAVTGLAMRLPFFGVGPMLEDDHLRYALDGALAAAGLDPYRFSPAELLQGVASEAYSRVGAAGLASIGQINFPELRSIYPGSSQLVFAAAHYLDPWGLDGLRAVFLLSEALTAVLCWRLLGLLGLPGHLVALLWCNPLLSFALTGQAHVDAVLGPPLLLAILAVRRHAGAIAGAAIGFAIGVKLWPVMLAPLLLRSLSDDRREMLRFVAAMGAIAFVACAPLLYASLSASNSGLVVYATRWHMNNMPYEWVSHVGYLVAGGAGLERFFRAIVVLTCVGLGIAIALPPLFDLRDLVTRLAWLSAAVFYLSPAQFPWYAFWFVPFAVLSRNWALLVATASLPTYFLFFPLAGPVWGDVYRYWLSGLHLIPVAIVAAMISVRLPTGMPALQR